MRERRAIVIPLDGSETSTIALGAAQAIANIMEAMLYIVHVSEEMLSEEQLLKRLKVNQIKARNFSIHQAIGVDVIDEILGFASNVHAEMIIMSSHGWTYNPLRLLGSTTMGVLQHSDQPVMVIRPDLEYLPDTSWEPKKMLVPQDGSPTAATAMGIIFSLAKLMHLNVDVLNIGVIGEKQPTEVGTIVPPKYLDYPRYDWPAWATEFVERFYTQHPPEVKLSLFEREGDPANLMTKFALENHDDLITLSWHGHLEEQRAPIIKGVLRKTELPVLLIRTKE